MSTNEKLEVFRLTLQAAQHQWLINEGFQPEMHRHDCRVKLGRKYANVDVGDSGKYMVVLETSDIFGIKGYGVIHRGHHYGTLDTINEWDWAHYTAVPQRSKVAA